MAKWNQFGFNPRPYVRGDMFNLYLSKGDKSFNPRPYVRGDINQMQS